MAPTATDLARILDDTQAPEALMQVLATCGSSLSLEDLGAWVQSLEAQKEDTVAAVYQAATVAPPVQAAALFLMASAHFGAREDTGSALDALAMANEWLPAGHTVLRRMLVRRLLANRLARQALAALLRDALEAEGAFTHDEQSALRQAFDTPLHDLGDTHGHGLLIKGILQHRALGRLQPHQRVIEIGTTREITMGQASTEELARFCALQGLAFTTVDMDPFNSTRARDLFARRGFAAQAVTQKGEDYLDQNPGPFHFVFLDAYDFDHGLHSERRQERYEAYLGARIDEAACHQMHLDCSQSLVRKLAPGGLVCIDDTWRDSQGAWCAKGTLAVPYLLENGFSLVAARNKAALLERRDPTHSPQELP